MRKIQLQEVTLPDCLHRWDDDLAELKLKKNNNNYNRSESTGSAETSAATWRIKLMTQSAIYYLFKKSWIAIMIRINTKI